RLGRQVCSALEAAHAAGIAHGLVTSTNVFVETDAHTGHEVARLSDFACATLGENVPRAAKLDPLPDVRGVGALIHELVTGATGGPAPDFRTLYSTDVDPA